MQFISRLLSIVLLLIYYIISCSNAGSPVGKIEKTVNSAGNKETNQKQVKRLFSLEDVGIKVSGKYEESHATDIDHFASPYVEEYAEFNSINLDAVKRALFPPGVPKGSGPQGLRVIISSDEHITGAWTFIRSDQIVLYEMIKVQPLLSDSSNILVLYNIHTPVRAFIDRFSIEWRLALLDDQFQLITNSSFEMHIPYKVKGLWDAISTNLSIVKGQPQARFTYSHSGGGGSRDLKFTCNFQAQLGPMKLQLLGCPLTLDEYTP